MTTHDMNPNTQPEVIARGLLIEAGRVLLCRNRKHGYAYLPGGHIDPGETGRVALAREFMEEAGLAVKVGDCLMVGEVVVDGFHEINLVFHVERAVTDGAGPEEQPAAEIISQEDHIGFDWLDLAAVVDADIRPASAKAWLASGGVAHGPPVSFVSETEPSA